MNTQRNGSRIAAAAWALAVLAAPAVVWAGSTPLPGSAGSRTIEELNQPNFASPRTEKPKPHFPRLAPRAENKGHAVSAEK
ncbi:MAG: hypothetical protein JOY71_06685 [Acetobacteraceae bacterium]|nr:hypothetical protein [Acetobacteraceae bacterium]MBV8521797.1 hypothetical protein [Acetobacteraceae bacterium]